MKKLLKFLPGIIALLVISSLFYLHPPLVLADYQSANQDFVYNYQLYRNAYSNYQVAKSTYQTYQTLTSQNDALDKLRTVLSARDQVMSVYYDLLQEKINITPGVSDDYKTTYFNIKTSEKNWLAAHQQKITAAATLDDLNSTSAEFESRYKQMDTETKQTIGMILMAKEAVFRGRLDDLIASLSGKLAQIRSLGADTTVAERGVLNAKTKLDLYQQNYGEARVVFFSKDIYSSQGIDIFKGEQKLLSANQYLREAVNFLLEIIKGITG